MSSAIKLTVPPQIDSLVGVPRPALVSRSDLRPKLGIPHSSHTRQNRDETCPPPLPLTFGTDFVLRGARGPSAKIDPPLALVGVSVSGSAFAPRYIRSTAVRGGSERNRDRGDFPAHQRGSEVAPPGVIVGLGHHAQPRGQPPPRGSARKALPRGGLPRERRGRRRA